MVTNAHKIVTMENVEHAKIKSLNNADVKRTLLRVQYVLKKLYVIVYVGRHCFVSINAKENVTKKLAA